MKDERTRDKAIEKLVAAKLSAQLKPQGAGCLGADGLAAYVERTLAPGERLACENHLAACARCQELVAELVRLMEAEAPVAATGAKAQVPRVRWFRVAWAAPALLALIIAGVWSTGEYRRRWERTEEARLKAPTPAASSPAAMEDTNAPATSGEPARSETQQFRAARKQVRKMAPAESSAPQVSANPALTHAGPGEGGGIGRSDEFSRAPQGVIVTPGVRARLAEAAPAVAGGVGVGEGAGTLGKLESNAPSKDSSLSVAARPAPPAAAPARDLEPQRYGENKLSEHDEARQKEAPVVREKVLLAPTELDSLTSRLGASPAHWRVGRRGLIDRLNASGRWVKYPSGVKADLNEITFPSPSVGWVVGENGTILRTEDAGMTWIKISSPTTDGILHVTATNDREARISTRNGETFATTDGGKSWTSSPQQP